MTLIAVLKTALKIIGIVALGLFICWCASLEETWEK